MTNQSCSLQNPAPPVPFDVPFQYQFRWEKQSFGDFTMWRIEARVSEEASWRGLPIDLMRLLIAGGMRILEGSAAHVMWQVDGYAGLFRARRDGRYWIIERLEYSGWNQCDDAWVQVALGSGRAISQPEPVPPSPTVPPRPDVRPLPPEPAASPSVPGGPSPTVPERPSVSPLPPDPSARPSVPGGPSPTVPSRPNAPSLPPEPSASPSAPHRPSPTVPNRPNASPLPPEPVAPPMFPQGD